MSRVRVWDVSELGQIPPTPETLLLRLEGPALLRVPGRHRDRVRAVATLIHGDEPSGIRAIHGWLRAGRTPATDTVIFLASVEAALTPPRWGHRFLPGGTDLNRCFREPFPGPEGSLAQEALDLLRTARPSSLVDLHNTSGTTPPYGVGPEAGPVHLALASRFAPRFVHADLQMGTLVEATREDFPSVVIECGRRGDGEADRVAQVGLEAYLDAEDPTADPATPMALFEDPVRIRLRSGVRLAFGPAADAEADLTVRADIDRHNLEPLPPGTIFGWLAPDAPWPLTAPGPDGRDLSRDLFFPAGPELLTRRELIPIMLTCDPAAAAGDCLLYAARRRAAVSG